MKNLRLNVALRFLLGSLLVAVGSIVGWFLNDKGYMALLTPTQCRSLLETIITITGIASALVFSILIQRRNEAKQSSDIVYNELHPKQRELNLFRELCRASMTSYNIWNGLGLTGKKDLSQIKEQVIWHPKEHQYPYVVLLYAAICEVGNGCYDEYHDSDEGQQRLSIPKLISLQEKIASICYLLERPGSREEIEGYLQQVGNGRASLVYNRPKIELLAQKFSAKKIEKFGHFTTPEYWRALSGYIADELCDDMLKLSHRLDDFSLNQYLGRGEDVDLILSGIIFPCVLLSFEYSLPWNLYVYFFYADLVLFSIGFYKVMKNTRNALREDPSQNKVEG